MGLFPVGTEVNIDNQEFGTVLGYGFAENQPMYLIKTRYFTLKPMMGTDILVVHPDNVERTDA